MLAMGAIWTRIWGKPSTKDVLERISVQLSDIEDFKRDTQAWHKKVIGYLLLYFSSLYFLAAAVVYFRFFHDPEWRHWSDQLKLFAPFLVAPLILWVVKRTMTWWYRRKLRKNEEKLDRLRDQKSKLLEEVMEKETYKVAKEILDKYGSGIEQLRPKTSALTSAKLSSQASSSTSAGVSADIRRRSTPAAAVATPQQPKRDDPNSSIRQQMALTSSPRPALDSRPSASGAADRSMVAMSPAAGGRGMMGASQFGNGGGGMQGGGRRAPGPPLPRPVLPRERGYMDKVVEYLVGDGPSNRFALICKQCQSHNGMALREEFEYIAYRCCYCFYWNPARKQRPTAPRLPSMAAGGGAGLPGAAASAATASTASSTESTDDDESTEKPTSSLLPPPSSLPQPAQEPSKPTLDGANEKTQPETRDDASNTISDSATESTADSEDNEIEITSQAKDNDGHKNDDD